MDSKILGAIISSFIASLVGSLFTILKISSDSKIKIENIDKQIEEIKKQIETVKTDVDQKMLLNHKEFISRKEFEMFLKLVENIDKNMARLNDKIDQLNKK